MLLPGQIKRRRPVAAGRIRRRHTGAPLAGRVRDVVRDLLKRGYRGGFSIEPHLAAVVHEGKEAAQGAYEVYVEYGRRFMKLIEELE